MSAAHEELVELLDERGIGYSTSDGQAVRLDLRGQVAVYRITAGVEPETDLFQVVGRSPVLVREGFRPAADETIARHNYGLRWGQVRAGSRGRRSAVSGVADPGRRAGCWICICRRCCR